MIIVIGHEKYKILYHRRSFQSAESCISDSIPLGSSWKASIRQGWQAVQNKKRDFGEVLVEEEIKL